MPNSAKLAKFKVERMVPTYSMLRSISYHAFHEAKKKESGRTLNYITSMLFSAFCLEAFLNHLGTQKLDYWDVLKKKLGPTEKLDVLSKVIGYEADMGRRPFQTFERIFTFRKLLVHGETEYLVLEGERALAENEQPDAPLTEWEKLATPKIAERFLKDSLQMMEALHTASGLPGGPLFTTEEIITTIRR